MKRTKEPSEQLKAVLKTEYQKQGITISTGGLSGDVIGFGFEMELKNKTVKGVVTNGKLRREERRKVVKKLLYALKTGYLGKVDFIKKDNVRGAYIFREDYEKLKEGEK